MIDDEEFKLEEIQADSDFEEGFESTRIFDKVDLGKPEGDEFFKLYNFDGKGFKGFANGLICKRRDAQGILQPYLIRGNDDFRAKVKKKIKKTQWVKLGYGITTNERLFIWPFVIVQDAADAYGWHLTGWEIAQAALTRWTGIQSDKTIQQYIHIDLEEQGQVPKKDVFENPPKEMGYVKALNTAFKGRVVNNEEHPIYKNAGNVVTSKFSAVIKAAKKDAVKNKGVSQ